MPRTLSWDRTKVSGVYLTKIDRFVPGANEYRISKDPDRRNWWTLDIRISRCEYALVNYHNTLAEAKEAAQQHVNRYEKEN